tara:strand:+ start:1787 stop:1975 length:189 start_codon:yes stop_codon:yes gene_type:complete
MVAPIIRLIVSSGKKLKKNKQLKKFAGSFFNDKKAIKKAEEDNRKARKTAAQKLKDRFNKDK